MVVSLAAQCLVGAWWIDGVRSMAIVYFLIRKAARRGPAANAAVVNRSRHYKTRYKTLTLRLKCINDFNM